MYNLGQHYLDVAAKSPDFPALVGAEAAFSHAEFANLILTLSGHLQSLGIGRGSVVAINTTSTPVMLGVTFATALLGSGLVVANRYLAREKNVTPTHFLRSPEVAGHPAVPFQVLDLAWISSGKPARLPDFGLTDPDAPWLFLHSSGTTGTPKYIGLPQSAIRDRSKAAEVDFPFRATTLATLFPCTSRPFLARAIAALLQACAIVDEPAPERWGAAGVNFVAASPVQIKAALAAPLPRKLARLEVSGAKIPPDAAQVYLQSFDRVLDVYGASETAKSFATELYMDANGLVAAKGLPQDSEVQILRDDGSVCGVGEMGTVRVRNAYMCAGYIGQPEASAKAFRDGWFYPGDFAKWGEHGELVVLGRQDDVINLGGFKLQADLADALVNSVDGVVEAAVFRNPLPNAGDPLIAFVVFRDKAQIGRQADEIVKLFERTFGFGLTLRNVKPVPALPRDEDGQVDRRACANLVVARAAVTDGPR